MSTPKPGKPEQTEAGAALDAQVRQVLRLHKQLIAAERQRYERVNGPLASNYQLLGLISNDPSFAWLRPLTLYIVEVEERLDEKTPVGADELTRFSEMLRRLLTAPDDETGFNERYVQVLFDDATVAQLHSAIVPSLAAPEAGG